MNIPAALENRSLPFKIALGLALIAAIGSLDLFTGYELSFSLFYVIPISVVTWMVGRKFGILASIASAGVWLAADLASGHMYRHPLIPAWNTFIRLAVFIIITFLLSELLDTLKREKVLARTDYLTGAVNSRNFFELLQMEILRLQRYQRPFTLVYFDVDNFKSINDRLGHNTGDLVLRTVVTVTREQVRRTDIIARMGGDEFVILLPETDEHAARIVLAKLQSCLQAEMQAQNWGVTFSFGVLTCAAATSSAEQYVRMVDELMYTVKHNNKNAAIYRTFTS